MTQTKPFDLWSKMPPVLQAILPNVMWNRARLHALVLPTSKVAIAELRWQLDLPWWRVDEQRFAVSPNQVRREPERYATQWQRTLAADLAFPIDLLEGERLVILDGVHRLLKADQLGHDVVNVRILDARRFAEIVERGEA